MKQAWRVVPGLFVFILVVGCDSQPDVHAFTGQTMGTTYSIKIIPPGINESWSMKKIQEGVDSVLVEVNRQMSTYLTESEVSRFNRWPAEIPFKISKDFAYVLSRAHWVSEKSRGAFDITIKPVVSLWGFDAADLSRSDWGPPDSLQLDSVSLQVGYRYLALNDTEISKKIPLLKLDLNAIAKGYGVDAVSEYLELCGFSRFMVEIGGEIRCRGMNQYNKPWQIGIETPQTQAMPGESIYLVVPVLNRSMATSGDYRNYFEFRGKLLSHAIDPRTGYPTKSRVASATVLAKNCTDADALATALMVMGEIEGLKLIESLPSVETLLIIRKDDGAYRQSRTTGFPGGQVEY